MNDPADDLLQDVDVHQMVFGEEEPPQEPKHKHGEVVPVCKCLACLEREKIEQYVRPTLARSVGNLDYVGSAPSDEAYQMAIRWLEAAMPNSMDRLSREVAELAARYAALREEKARQL